MNQTQLTAAAAACHSIQQADGLAHEGWQQWAEGNLSDSAAERLQAAVSARKTSLRTKAALPPEPPPTTLQRRPARGPAQRKKSILRRRRLVMSGAIPASLATSFTMGEIACMTVIARECQKQRDHRCSLSVNHIAALSGTSSTVVRTALREARQIGLITVTERRRPRQRSQTNLIHIVGPEWCAWLRLKTERGWVKKSVAHVITEKKEAGRSSFVLINGEERHSPPDKPGRRAARLPRSDAGTRQHPVERHRHKDR